MGSGGCGAWLPDVHSHYLSGSPAGGALPCLNLALPASAGGVVYQRRQGDGAGASGKSGIGAQASGSTRGPMRVGEEEGEEVGAERASLRRRAQL